LTQFGRDNDKEHPKNTWKIRHFPSSLTLIFTSKKL